MKANKKNFFGFIKILKYLMIGKVSAFDSRY